MDIFIDGRMDREKDFGSLKKKEMIIGYLKVKLQKFKRFFNFFAKMLFTKKISQTAANI
jgi:hypothetical protein